jgi:hypothetical protein
MKMFWASAIAHSQILQHPQLKKDEKWKMCTSIKEIINQKSMSIIASACIHFWQTYPNRHSPTLRLLNK